METSCQLETHYGMSLTWKSFLLHPHTPINPPTLPGLCQYFDTKCSQIFHCFVIVMNQTFPSCTPHNMLNKTTKVFPSYRICTPHNSSKTCSNHRIGEVGQKFFCRGRKHFWSFWRYGIFDIQISIVLEYPDLQDEMQRWHKAPNGTSYGLHWRWFDRFLYLQKFQTNKIFCIKKCIGLTKCSNTIISDDKIILINAMDLHIFF